MESKINTHPNVVNFNDRRLDIGRRPRPRYGNATQDVIDDLHRLRVFWDERARELNLPRYFELRPYEIEQQQSMYADRTPTMINQLVTRLRRLARPAIVLRFPGSGDYIRGPEENARFTTFISNFSISRVLNYPKTDVRLE